VFVSERESFGVELTGLDRQGLTDPRSHLIALSTVLVEQRVDEVIGKGFAVRRGVGDHPGCHGTAFLLIAVEETLLRPPVVDSDELPREILRVRDTGVEPMSAPR